MSAERSGGQLRFRHALLRDAAYALISAEELRSAHSLAAAHLESTDDEPAVIAAHCERGGDATRAIHHYALAARRANRRNDGSATLELVERCAKLGASGVELGMLRSIECLAHFFHRHDFDAAWRAARAALELLPSGHPQRSYAVATTTFVALQMGRMAEVTPLIDELLTGEPGEGDRTDVARAIGYAAIVYMIQADRIRARRLLARIAELDRSSGDDVLVRGQLRYWEVRFEVLLGDDPLAALEIARRGAADLEVAGDWQIACSMWAEIGECTRRSRSLSRSLPDLRKAVDYARACRERVSTAFVSSYLAGALADLGTPQAAAEAHALCREILELTAPGSIYRALGNVACALAHLATRDFAGAKGCARSGHAEMHALGLHAYYPHVDNALIRTLLATGDTGAAAAVADEALRNADAHGPLGLLEPALRVAAARARLAAGRRADAIDDVQRALAALHARLAKLEVGERAAACAEVPENAELLALADELGLRLPA